MFIIPFGTQWFFIFALAGWGLLWVSKDHLAHPISKRSREAKMIYYIGLSICILSIVGGAVCVILANSHHLH